MAKTANHIVKTSFCNGNKKSNTFQAIGQIALRTEYVPIAVNIEEIERVYPSRSIAATQITEPPIMYGLRLPKRDFELSARTPEMHE